VTMPKNANAANTIMDAMANVIPPMNNQSALSSCRMPTPTLGGSVQGRCPRSVRQMMREPRRLAAM
jgi:hypothetical protein